MTLGVVVPVERETVFESDTVSIPVPELIETAQKWFRDFLRQPHEKLGRDGHVCPFVLPAEVAGTVRFEVAGVAPDLNLDGARELVRCMIDIFSATVWPHSNPQLRTLVLVVHGLPDPALPLLDVLHASVKPQLAARGLMLGQFHPRCPEPAARNREFLVARAPIPMLALRNMALHDVLFVHDDRTCFHAYDARFARRYEQGAALDPLFVSLFSAARERFGPSAAARS